ncbi:Nif3-like dinuclear metal center hexameric protein [Niabella drilacis]|uniref:GTP cyclohydrolase 1 type 2 homolog n=1 Tax=Niabella drilacis (strain DSM 25811 / CCM 8410 / CCUG 62505 / LMG 26954 / E90) TaxID=1285928 RepID=A0A1G6JDW0_NIADE|nr:Nif3-like dinuclear metal center hexameric protein [Niabella drilacis]SDC16879.1 dinuclear metal center protein, YbgI/SA1388 family [Niabella drilacis]
MTIRSVIDILEAIAPPTLQEGYDNAGLLTGQQNWHCTGVLCCLDAVETVVDEAIEKNCNLVIAHHPIVFAGLKKINGNNYVERTIIKAIKHDIALYAIHTNLDNVLQGVNGMIAQQLGLTRLRILAPKERQLEKLYFFVPPDHAEKVMSAIFAAGGGQIGHYRECSFSAGGKGTFLPGNDARPFTGEIGKRHEAEEQKIEILYPFYLRNKILKTLRENHPYEEVAYETITLNNLHQEVGAGITGEFPEALEETVFLQKLKSVFHLPLIRHTALLGKKIRTLSICGGAGSFLTKAAINSGSDAYVTSDIKYHEFFDADGKILLADIGHYESEQFTIDLLHRILQEKILNFAVLKTAVNTNPVYYQ